MKTIGNPETLAVLVARLERLRPDTARRWGTLTSGQMLCHLGDAAASVLGERVLSGTSKVTTPRRILKWVALSTALPWPQGMPTPPGVDPLLEGTQPDDFDLDRRRVIDGLEKLASAGVLEPVHSAFGTMSLRDWHRWAFRHVDHHLKQFGL